MNVLILQGGARRTGNTATVIAWIADELQTLDHEMTVVTLQDKTIKGCLACGKCKQETKRIACVQNDDAVAILEKMVAADLVLFTSPLYFWGLTGPLKSLIDRTYSLYNEYHLPGHASLVAGQRQALLVTGAGPYENNAEPVFAAFSRLQAPHKAVNAGELYIGSCTKPANLGAEVEARARDFARQIVA